MKITDLKISKRNPRFIKDEKFKKLVKSLKEFPKMMELRPIIYDSNTMEILGGNMRYKALLELSYEEIDEKWIKDAKLLTDDEKKRFIIADNLQFGEWDIDIIEEEWSKIELVDFGFDDSLFYKLPDFNINDEKSDEKSDEKNIIEKCPKCGFEWKK